MIPKTVHYCWFGRGELPKAAKKCIASWRRYCPDYEIVRWDEDSFPLEPCPGFVRQAYEARKYAFVSDYVRLAVLYEHGGIYADTDVEFVASMDFLLDEKGVIGFENDSFVNSGQLLASEAGNPLLREMMERYDKEDFIDSEGRMTTLGCPVVNTEILVAHGLVRNGREQRVAGFHVYPADWFNPLCSATGVLNKTENTKSIHWYSMSWMSKRKQLRNRLARPFRRLFGEDFFRRLKK